MSGDGSGFSLDSEFECLIDEFTELVSCSRNSYSSTINFFGMPVDICLVDGLELPECLVDGLELPECLGDGLELPECLVDGLEFPAFSEFSDFCSLFFVSITRILTSAQRFLGKIGFPSTLSFRLYCVASCSICCNRSVEIGLNKGFTGFGRRSCSS